ncbi:hypothetical protein WJX72_004151 [[Myrmecia] bisecta]|uniref:DUF1989 domain-containing protein n=1 Tax=[Myrmecia] bisecta TaxID=41462 RepID=A0AAW1R6J9_9CHLO
MMSWHHARYAISRMMPKAGDVLVTNQRQPILTFLEDTGPGLHDTTVAACDYNLYLEELGKEGADEHDSCINNLHTALGELGLELLDPAGRKLQPAPLNLWMSGLPVHAPATEADLYWAEPPKGQKPGDYVIFRAEQDCVAAMSACPYDILPISGTEGPKDVHFAVEG